MQFHTAYAVGCYLSPFGRGDTKKSLSTVGFQLGEENGFQWSAFSGQLSARRGERLSAFSGWLLGGPIDNRPQVNNLAHTAKGEEKAFFAKRSPWRRFARFTR
jgi:hypothetical protein